MESNDEDFELFLKEFMGVLNKYHYVINHRIRINKFHDPDSEIIAVQADGRGMWLVAKVDGKLYSTNTQYSEQEEE